MAVAMNFFSYFFSEKLALISAKSQFLRQQTTVQPTVPPHASLSQFEKAATVVLRLPPI
jgi:hypothetical protein